VLINGNKSFLSVKAHHDRVVSGGLDFLGLALDRGDLR